jgi:hypothetical protein
MLTDKDRNPMDKNRKKKNNNKEGKVIRRNTLPPRSQRQDEREGPEARAVPAASRAGAEGEPDGLFTPRATEGGAIGAERRRGAGTGGLGWTTAAGLVTPRAGAELGRGPWEALEAGGTAAGRTGSGPESDS